MILRERQVALQILTPCTLKCRLCADYSPLYMERKEYYYVTFDNYCREISEVFKIYDYIEEITITGGEPLLHKELAKIVSFTLENFSNQFKVCRIFSNGTILPNDKLLKVISEYSSNNFEWVMDHYGTISQKAEETVSLLEENHIPYRVNRYYGEEQHCGGWINYGSLAMYRNYSTNVVQNLFNHCHSAAWKNLLVFKGKLFLCTQAAFGFDMGFFSLAPSEYIDLFSEEKTLEEKREIAAGLGHTVITACQYCNGFDAENSKRYPAGEQQ